MEKQRTHRPWWDELKLGDDTVRLLTKRGADSPGVLAWGARAGPDDFRRFFSEETRAELTRAISARIGADGVPQDEGLSDLLSALEEIAGKRPLKPPAPLPEHGFGALDPGPTHPLNPPPKPLPRLPKLGVHRAPPPHAPNPHTDDHASAEN